MTTIGDDCPCALHEEFGKKVVIEDDAASGEVRMTENMDSDGNPPKVPPSMEEITQHLLRNMSREAQSATLHRMKLLDGFMEELDRHEEWAQTGCDRRADADPNLLPHDDYLHIVSKLLRVHNTAARQLQSFDSFMSLLPHTFSELAPVVWRNGNKVIFAHFGKLTMLPPQQPIPEGHTLLRRSARAKTLVDTIDRIEVSNHTGVWDNPRSATLGLDVEKSRDAQWHRDNHSMTEPHLTPEKGEQSSLDRTRMWADTALFPHEAIRGGWSYCVVLVADLHWREIEYFPGTDRPPVVLQSGSVRNTLVGEMPIPVKSSFCYTHNLRPNALVALGECPSEIGGHLIVRGRLKVMVMPERPRANQLLVVQKTTGVPPSSGPSGSMATDHMTAAQPAAKPVAKPAQRAAAEPAGATRSGLHRHPSSLPDSDPCITPGTSNNATAMQHIDTAEGGGLAPQSDPHSSANKYLTYHAQVQSIAEYGCFSPSMFTVQFELSHIHTAAVSARKGMSMCVSKTVPVTPPQLVLRSTFHRLRDPMPVIALLRALGAGSDSQIASMIVQDESDHAMFSLIQPSFANAAAEGVVTEQQALMLVHNMVQPRQPGEPAPSGMRTVAHDADVRNLSMADKSYVFKMLQLHLLPHVGVTTRARADKIVYICHVIREFLRVILGRRSPDVRDMYRNKTLQTIGLFMRNIVNKAFYYMRSQIEGTFLVLIRNLHGKEECKQPGGLAKIMAKMLTIQSSPFTAHTLFVLTNGNVPNSSTGGAIHGSVASNATAIPGIVQQLSLTSRMSILSHLSRVTMYVNRLLGNLLFNVCRVRSTCFQIAFGAESIPIQPAYRRLRRHCANQDVPRFRISPQKYTHSGSACKRTQRNSFLRQEQYALYVLGWINLFT